MKNDSRTKRISKRKPVLITPETERRPRIRLLPRFLFLLLLMITLSVSTMQGTAGAHSLPRPRVQMNSPLNALHTEANWYFAEGEVGAGFQEFLTLSNPDAASDCTVNVQYLNQGNTTASFIKPRLVKSVTVPHSSRVTLNVNTDLNIPMQQHTGQMISAIVSTGGVCPGIIAERPMYFTSGGVRSGMDVMGATALSNSWYFADIPVKAGAKSYVSSYLSILNPSTTTASVVTATYYAGGVQVGTQSVTVAGGARGTLYPDQLGLPANVTAVVTATVPVVVERPSVMNNMAEGAAGVVSGAVSVSGAPQLSDHWYFAEGYTGNKYQENLVVSNPTNTTTAATITLEYNNGHTQSVVRQIPAWSQVVVDVNALNAHPTGNCNGVCVPTSEVSAEVTADHPNLVVERQMFMQYQQSKSINRSTVATPGWTDVTGVLTPMSSASFSEGYINPNYNEWLVLQNPNAGQVRVQVTLMNALGHQVQQVYTLRAKSRSTVDITSLAYTSHLVQQHDSGAANTISMSVQGVDSAQFIAERPMYFNTGINGQQGATDVMGFSGTLDGPDGITVDSNGTGWFTEYDGSSIDSITSTRVITRYSVGLTPHSKPAYITVGPDHNLWFTEEAADKIGMLNPTTGVITEYSNGLTAGGMPQRIIAASDGNLWFTDYGASKIGKITTAGVITEYPLASGSEPWEITAGSGTLLWFTESGTDKIASIDTTNGSVTEYTPPNGDSIVGIAVSGGKVYFSEQGRNRLGIFTPAVGTPNTQGYQPPTFSESSVITTPNTQPAAIIPLANGVLGVVESNVNQIATYNTWTDTFTEYTAGMGIDSAPWDMALVSTTSNSAPVRNRTPNRTTATVMFTDYSGNQVRIATVDATNID